MDTPLPEALLTRLDRIYPPDIRKSILDAYTAQRPTTLRVNTLKTTRDTFLHSAMQSGIELDQIPWFPLGFILKNPALHEFSETPLYTNGHCYVQSLSSMLPPLLLNPQPSERVLDIAAAPGSKTSQIAAMMNNTGEIVANDSSHIRLYKLKANLERLGVTNVTVTRGVGQGLWHDYPEYFDKTLVDVPCSMEGRIEVSSPKSYGFWSTKKIKELQEVQKFLLRSAVSATRPGGTIVYSTCTLAPEENEAVIDWILKKEKGTLAVEEITLSGPPWYPALSQWNEKIFHRDIEKTVRLNPDGLFEGFYIAKLIKLGRKAAAS